MLPVFVVSFKNTHMFKNNIKIAFSIKNPPALLDAENKPNAIINQLIPSMTISSMI